MTIPRDLYTACGWPFLALSSGRSHGREMVSAHGPIAGNRLTFPLPPGYEGGPVADENARGIGIIGPTFGARGLLSRPAFIPSSEALRFLESQGLRPPAERADHDRSRQTKLGWLQNSTVQIECYPPRPITGGMPRMVWSASIGPCDIVGLGFAERAGHLQVVADLLCDSGARSRKRLHARTGKPETAGLPIAKRAASVQYRRDGRGNLYETDARGVVVRDLAYVNGFRGFNAVGALEPSLDGRILLAGDAIIWSASGTVIWRAEGRADDLLHLSPDGQLLAHAPAGSRGTAAVWRLPAVTP